MEQFFGANVRNTLLDDIGADLIYIQKLKMAEHHLYGSSRLGVRKDSLYLYDTRFQASSVDTLDGSYDKDSIYFEDSAMVDTLWASRTLTHKRYELSNHLGNVLSTITDRKTYVDTIHVLNGEFTVEGGDTTFLKDTLVQWDADVLLAQDYYPAACLVGFADESMLMPDRIFQRPASIDTTGAERDSSYRYRFNGQEKTDEISGSGNHTTAMFWEYDTRLGRRWNQDPKPNPSISNYAAFANNPIWFSDPLGDTVKIKNNGETIIYTPGMEYSGENEFIETAVNDLNRVSKTEKGLHVVEQIVNSDGNYNIIEAETFEQNRFTWDEKKEVGGTIHLFTGSGHMDGVKFYSGINLGHEIKHAYDRDKGLGHGEEIWMKKRKWGIPVDFGEHSAVKFENYLRSEWREKKMRTMYTGHSLPFPISDDPSYYLSPFYLRAEMGIVIKYGPSVFSPRSHLLFRDNTSVLTIPSPPMQIRKP